MPLSPNRILGYWCNKAAQAFRSQLDKHVKPLGLKWSEAILLLLLYGKPSSLVELARYLEHAHPSVLRQIDSLEKSGLIERSMHPDDRRIKIVSLTESGKKTAEQVHEVALQTNAKAIVGFSHEKAESAISILRDIITNLGETERLDLDIAHLHNAKSHSKELSQKQGTE